MSADTEKLAAEHLVAPEAAQVTRGTDAVPPQAAEPEFARLGDRFLAQVVDALVGVGVFFFVGDVIAPRFGGGTATGFDLSGWPAAVVITIIALIMLAYFILAEHWTGATLGKVVAGIRVQTPGGQHIDLRASLYRNLMRIIDVVLFYLVGAIAILATTRKQRLGDMVAHSVVVWRNTSRASQVGALVAALTVFLGGIAGGNWMLHHAGGAAQTPPVAVTQPQTPQGAATQAQTPQGTTGQAPSAPAPVPRSGDLKIADFAFLKEKGGAARPEGPYKPGDTVYANIHVVGFTTDPKGQVDLRYTAASFDPSRLPVYAPGEQAFHRSITPATTSVEIYFNTPLPEYAPPGTYEIQFKVHDAVKNTDAELTRAFTVEAAPLAPATRLELRDLHLSLSENGPPVTRPVVRAGQTVYMSAEVMGMNFDGDRLNVHVSLQVVGPGGAVVLDKPDFVDFSQPVQYRPAAFFTKITGQVTTSSNTPKGTYTEKYDVTDKIANTTAHYEATFEVQ